jgi:hypothetical protein
MTMTPSALCSKSIDIIYLFVQTPEKTPTSPPPTSLERLHTILSSSPPPVALGATIVLLTTAGAMYRHYSGKGHSTHKQKLKNEENKQDAGRAFIFSLVAFILQGISTAGLLNVIANIGLTLSFIPILWYFSQIVLD